MPPNAKTLAGAFRSVAAGLSRGAVGCWLPEDRHLRGLPATMTLAVRQRLNARRGVHTSVHTGPDPKKRSFSLASDIRKKYALLLVKRIVLG